MNWTKFINFFAPALLCVSCFLAPDAWAQEEPALDATGLLTINQDVSYKLTNEKLKKLIDDLIAEPNEEDDAATLMGIKILENGTLEIASGTNVALGGSYLSVNGKLIIYNNSATKIYGVPVEEEEEEEESIIRRLDMDGGTIVIQSGDLETDTDGTDRTQFIDADVNLGSNGGTFDIAVGEILKIGQIKAGTTGDLDVIGTGTFQVGKVTMNGGTLDVQLDTMHFIDGAQVGKLNVAEDTTIDGSRGEEANSDFYIMKGGTISGTMKDIGSLLAGDGSNSTLTFEGGSHTIDSLAIQRGATVDLQSDTSIKLDDPPEITEENDTDTETAGTEEDATDEETETAVAYDDLQIYGTLQVSSANKAGIYKGNIGSLELENVYLTVSGNTDSETGEVINGIVEIYKSNEDSDDPEELIADTLHTEILGLGKITVDKNVIFQSGSVKFGKGTPEQNLTGGHLFVDGGGTYRAGEIDLGTGYLLVQEEGTKMEFLGTAKAGALITDAGTNIIAHDDAEFGAVNLAGDYDADGNSLKIEQGGRIAGKLINVNNLTLGGDLLIQVSTVQPEDENSTMSIAEDSSTALITANTLEIDTDKTHIRLSGLEAGTHTISKVFKIEDTEGRTDLLNVLKNSQSALYQGNWKIDQETGIFSVEVSLMSTSDYVHTKWENRGVNIANAAKLLDYLVSNYDCYLNDLQCEHLDNLLRTMTAGELAGNAARIALQQPASSIFRHLDTTVPLRFPFAQTRGQVREGFNLWFNPYGQSERADSDGTTFDGYDMTRFGFHLGGDIELYNRALLGVLFGYSSPQVKSELGKVSADDFTAGLYLRVPTAWAVVANLMVGFGNQDYTYNNNSSYYDSEYRGSSFFASAELTRPIDFQAYRLTPLIALDFQSTEIDGFLVSEPQILQWMYVKPDDVSQAALRFGLLGNLGRFRTRLQYTRQIAGDDYVSSRTAWLGDLSAGTQIRSTQWGKDWLNVGVGGEVLRTHYWRIFADYNFDLGKHTTSHLGSLNAVLTW